MDIQLISTILWYALLYLMAGFYTYAGVSHFTNSKFFLRILPPSTPFALFLVYASGVVEILLGIGLCIPMFTSWAAWGVIALLILVYPVNIYMLWARLYGGRFKNITPTFLTIRLFIQILLILLAYLYV